MWKSKSLAPYIHTFNSTADFCSHYIICLSLVAYFVVHHMIITGCRQILKEASLSARDRTAKTSWSALQYRHCLTFQTNRRQRQSIEWIHSNGSELLLSLISQILPPWFRQRRFHVTIFTASWNEQWVSRHCDLVLVTHMPVVTVCSVMVSCLLLWTVHKLPSVDQILLLSFCLIVVLSLSFIAYSYGLITWLVVWFGGFYFSFSYSRSFFVVWA